MYLVCARWITKVDLSRCVRLLPAHAVIRIGRDSRDAMMNAIESKLTALGGEMASPLRPHQGRLERTCGGTVLYTARKVWRRLRDEPVETKSFRAAVQETRSIGAKGQTVAV